MPGTLRANVAMTSLTAHTVPAAARPIVKEREAFLRVWIDTDGFTLTLWLSRCATAASISSTLKANDAGRKLPVGWGAPAGTEMRKLNHILPIKRQIPFPRIARLR